MKTREIVPLSRNFGRICDVVDFENTVFFSSHVQIFISPFIYHREFLVFLEHLVLVCSVLNMLFIRYLVILRCFRDASIYSDKLIDIRSFVFVYYVVIVIRC